METMNTGRDILIMSTAVNDGLVEGSHLTLSIWHPSCWTLQVTEAHAGGLFGHGVYHNRDTGGVLQRGVLSERQREVFKLARRRGYYEWPREVSATELAEELDVSKATALEHLRKAEAKIRRALS